MPAENAGFQNCAIFVPLNRHAK